MNRQRVLIIGGGAAGWMAAVYLNRLLRPLGATVTLVESVKLGAADVGAASDPGLVRYLRGLGIDEIDFLQQASATYNLAAQLSNWTLPAESATRQSAWLPFGLCGGQINDLDLFHFWLKSVRAGNDEGPYSSYSLQAILAEADKAPRPPRGASPVMERGEYGYQLDRAGLADFLRELAVQEDVNHVFDDVQTVARDDAGGIQTINTRSGRSLSADLYLDCTGDAQIIERALGDPWLSWSNLFPCDRSVTLPLPREEELHPYTRVTALASGWMRQVALSHRVACTYHFSSRHVQDDAALRELLVRAAPVKVSPGEPRFQPLRPGRRTTFWLHNCVALGPSAGELEPLYPAEFLLIERLLGLLRDFFPGQGVNPALAAAFNRRAADVYDSARDLVLLHYAVRRGATDAAGFWQDAGSAPLPASLQELLALHDECGALAPLLPGLFPEPTYHHIFAAADRLPRRIAVAADTLEFARVQEIMAKMRAQNDDWRQRLPGHREFMEHVHRPAM
jgi:tryptophan halogenase